MLEFHWYPVSLLWAKFTSNESLIWSDYALSTGKSFILGSNETIGWIYYRPAPATLARLFYFHIIFLKHFCSITSTPSIHLINMLQTLFIGKNMHSQEKKPSLSTLNPSHNPSDFLSRWMHWFHAEVECVTLEGYVLVFLDFHLVTIKTVTQVHKQKHTLPIRLYDHH